MTLIDEKIVKIFNKLINGSYYLKEVNHGQYLFNINDILISIYVYLLLAQWLLFLIPCIVRIIDISDYNEKIKINKT